MVRTKEQRKAYNEAHKEEIAKKWKAKHAVERKIENKRSEILKNLPAEELLAEVGYYYEEED